MKSLQHIRQQWALSQQQLADYLGISRSVVSMCEQGKRELPVDALIKLGQLEISRNAAVKAKRKPAADATGKGDNTQLALQMRPLEKRLASCRYKAAVLQHRLQRMQQRFDRATRQVMVLEDQLNDSQGKKERLKTEIRLYELNKRRTTANPAAQFILQHHISLLLAEATAHEKALDLLRTGTFTVS